MPVITKRNVRRRAKSTEPDYYYAYIGQVFQGDVPSTIKRLVSLGIAADIWVSANSMVEYRIIKSEISKCPDMPMVSLVKGTHKTKGFPFVTGEAEFTAYLYEKDNTYFAKRPNNSWKPIVSSAHQDKGSNRARQ